MITLDGHQGIVTALAYSPDGRLLATGAADGRVKLWEPFSGREVLTCAQQGLTVTSLAFSHDGRLVARLDLKADRQGGTLRVRAAHREPTFADDKDLPALQTRLEELAGFLGLPDIRRVNEMLVKVINERIEQNIELVSPEFYLKQWYSMGGQASEQFMQMMAAGARAATGGAPEGKKG